MFRDIEDYNRGFNIFALALHKTSSTGLVESFMSNHVHMLVQTDNPDQFMNAFRMPYTKYFNHRHKRTGSLGEKHHFRLEVKGLHHHLITISYILRNALHHGVAPIPYAYPHSSVNVIFQKEMGKSPIKETIPSNRFYRYIGRHQSFPESYKMTTDGVFLRESVLDIPQVENMFVTPRNFDYYMSRRTTEDWIKEQEKDHNNAAPITLSLIESKVSMNSLEEMLTLESGRSDYYRISDIDLCRKIDEIVREQLHKSSIYNLTQEEKTNLARQIRNNYHPSNAQLTRCLALNYPTLQKK